MLELRSRQNMTGMETEQARGKCIANALVCPVCWTFLFWLRHPVYVSTHYVLWTLRFSPTRTACVPRPSDAKLLIHLYIGLGNSPSPITRGFPSLRCVISWVSTNCDLRNRSRHVIKFNHLSLPSLHRHIHINTCITTLILCLSVNTITPELLDISFNCLVQNILPFQLILYL